MGVPWARLAVTQYRFLPAVQSSSLFGSLFVSFLMALSNGFIAITLKNMFGLSMNDGKRSLVPDTAEKTHEKTVVRTHQRVYEKIWPARQYWNLQVARI